MAKRPPYVPECQLKELIKYWDSDKHKEEKKESGVSLKELFVVTRTRHPERSYKGSNEDTISKIAEMEEIEKQQTAYGSETTDPFSSVMGHEYPGHLRLYGRGVTKTSLKRKSKQF